jgi:hypothetical protein
VALSLDKKKELVGLQLAKRNVPTDLIMRVKSIMDVTGSFEWAFNDGTIQELYNRLIPVAMRFDDNQSLESYWFSNAAGVAPEIKPEDFDNYVGKFLASVPDKNLWNGTYYAKALEALWDDINGKETVSKGFFGLFKKEQQKSLYPPTYVMFVTDGDAYDETEADKLLAKFADKKTYIQLIGVGRGSSFNYLKRMADKYGHVGFVTFPDLEKTSDQKLYEAMLNDELCDWIKQQ